MAHRPGVLELDEQQSSQWLVAGQVHQQAIQVTSIRRLHDPAVAKAALADASSSPPLAATAALMQPSFVPTTS